MNTQLAVALASLALMTSTTAHADGAIVITGDTAKEVVRYSARDLSTPEGTRSLYARIGEAAARVCSKMVPAYNLPTSIDHLTCRRAALDGAVRNVNQSALTALHLRRAPERIARR
jgi:UrcA family protein